MSNYDFLPLSVKEGFKCLLGHLLSQKTCNMPAALFSQVFRPFEIFGCLR